MRFIYAPGQPHHAGEPSQAVSGSLRLGGAQVPDDRARAGVENPGRGGPRGLLVVLPPLRVAVLLESPGPRLGAPRRHAPLLGRREHKTGDAVLTRRQTVDIDD